MNRFVPMATTSFQPVGYYVPQPLVVTRTNAATLGATEFGAAKKKPKAGANKKKKKAKPKSKPKKPGFFQTTGKVLAAGGKEMAADYIQKKTGVDITGQSMPEEEPAIDTGTSEQEATPPAEEKKSNMPLIVGGIVAALALAGGGLYLAKRKKAQAQL